MRYLALGDSISIDQYTGVIGGGAASQFAKLIGAEPFRDLTVDGCVTTELLRRLQVLSGQFDLVTLTIGGNDLLQALWIDMKEPDVAATLNRIRQITGHRKLVGTRIIMNTVYDPTDGRPELADELGLRVGDLGLLLELNEGIREIAEGEGHLLADLQTLFRGRGFASEEPWLVHLIEPNLAGATQIARLWHALLQSYRLASHYSEK